MEKGGSFIKNAVLLIFAMALMPAISLISIIVTGGFVIILLSLVIMGVSDKDNFAEAKLKSDKAVGIVELVGEIDDPSKFLKALDKAEHEDKVKAIVIRIDSPGGAVGSSEEIYERLKAVDKKKPVVCSLGNMAASGGLYSAVGCRKIVSHKGTLTGSIGVIMMTPNFSSITDKLGFQMNTIKSGKFKDAGSPFKPFSDEDRNLLQTMVSKAFEQFLTVVATSRNIDKEKLRPFADGRIILGEEALDLGIVDELGGMDWAKKLAFELAGINDVNEPETINFSKPQGLKSIFEEISNIKLFSKINSSPRLEYRGAL